MAEQTTRRSNAPSVEDDPEFIKRQRKAECASFTRVVSKVRKLIDQRGSRTRILVLKEELEDHYRDCVQSNNAYAASTQISTADQARAADWGRDLNVYQTSVYAEIDNYLASRAGRAKSVMSNSSVQLDDVTALPSLQDQSGREAVSQHARFGEAPHQTSTPRNGSPQPEHVPTGPMSTNSPDHLDVGSTNGSPSHHSFSDQQQSASPAACNQAGSTLASSQHHQAPGSISLAYGGSTSTGHVPVGSSSPLRSSHTGSSLAGSRHLQAPGLISTVFGGATSDVHALVGSSQPPGPDPTESTQVSSQQHQAPDSISSNRGGTTSAGHASVGSSHPLGSSHTGSTIVSSQHQASGLLLSNHGGTTSAGYVPVVSSRPTEAGDHLQQALGAVSSTNVESPFNPNPFASSNGPLTNAQLAGLSINQTRPASPQNTRPRTVTAATSPQGETPSPLYARSPEQPSLGFSMSSGPAVIMNDFQPTRHGFIYPSLPSMSFGSVLGQPHLGGERAQQQTTNMFNSQPDRHHATNYGYQLPVSYYSLVSVRFPNIEIKPFDGDPRNWTMFLSSFKSLVHDELPNDALRLAALRELLSPPVRQCVADALYDPCQHLFALQSPPIFLWPQLGGVSSKITTESSILSRPVVKLCVFCKLAKMIVSQRKLGPAMLRIEAIRKTYRNLNPCCNHAWVETTPPFLLLNPLFYSLTCFLYQGSVSL